MKTDRAYLEEVAAQLRGEGLLVEIVLALGNPPAEIVKVAEAEHCDLIAMAGHGHRFFADLFHGSTITEVRHRTTIPILVGRAKKVWGYFVTGRLTSFNRSRLMSARIRSRSSAESLSEICFCKC